MHREDMKAAEEDDEEGEWQHVNATSLGGSRQHKQLKPRGKEHLELISSPNIIPSRGELLNIVRKHSGTLGQPGEEGELDPRFWCELLDLFFMRGLADRKSPQEDDDLVFFVRLPNQQYGESGSSQSQDPTGEPFFVRRWAPELGKVIGHSSGQVDWWRSFYLNLICHTTFSLTVAICSREGLQSHPKASNASLTPIYKVTNRVYASPSRANFQEDFRSKAVETVPAYPDICFVVDDYDNTFEDVVLTEADHCYCVLLNARGGAAFPPDGVEKIEGGETSAEMHLLDEAHGSSSSKVTLFSGFVSYDMVRTAFEGGRVKGLLQFSAASRSERLVMRGPGGRGAVDVAVSAVQSDASDRLHPPPPPMNTGAKSGLGNIVRKAATAAKQAIGAVSAGGKAVADAPLPLRCCLMSLSLPWDCLAYDLLFKGFSKQGS